MANQLLPSLWTRPTAVGWSQGGAGASFSHKTEGAGSELTLVLISRPCSPSREKMTKSLSRKKHLTPPPDILELRFQECLKVLAFVKLLSWRSFGPSDLRVCPQPASALTRASVLADLPGADLASPLGPCLCRGLCTQPPSPGPAPAECPPLLLTPPAVAWVTPLERALQLYTGISPPVPLSYWLPGTLLERESFSF